jgi:hypothetical protein
VDRATVEALLNRFRIEAEQLLPTLPGQLADAARRRIIVQLIGDFYRLLDSTGKRLSRANVAITLELGRKPGDPGLLAAQKRVLGALYLWTALAEGWSWYVRPAEPAEQERAEIGVAPVVAVMVVSIAAAAAVIALSLTGIAWAIVHWERGKALEREIDLIERDPSVASSLERINDSVPNAPGGGTNNDNDKGDGSTGMVAAGVVAAALLAGGIWFASRRRAA